MNQFTGNSIGGANYCGSEVAMTKVGGGREFSYEKYIQEMHSSISKLEDKIRPVSLETEGMLRAEKPTSFPSAGTRLEEELRGLMERLDRVVDAVIV